VKGGFAAIGIGIAIIIFGMIFFLQGKSIVGPTTSFMYSNPQWIVNGQWLIVAGIIILATGIGISLLHLRSS